MAFGIPARWSETRKFDASSDALLTAARSALDDLGWRASSSGHGALQARVSVSMWSWGERLEVRVDGGRVRCESRCVYGLFDWSKNRKNVETFFAALRHALDPVRAERV